MTYQSRKSQKPFIQSLLINFLLKITYIVSLLLTLKKIHVIFLDIFRFLAPFKQNATTSVSLLNWIVMCILYSKQTNHALMNCVIYAKKLLNKTKKLKINEIFNFFNCCLATSRPTLGHSQGDSLINLMLITAFYLYQPKGHQEPGNKVGSLSPAECLAGFEPGTFQF